MLAAALPQFTGPIEVLYGELSPMPALSSTSIAATFPSGHVASVPGAGHFLSMENPGCVRDAVRRLVIRAEKPD